MEEILADTVNVRKETSKDKKTLQDYQALCNSLQKENDQYTEQVKALRADPKTIEKEAREQLHYTRPGEVVYVAPSPPPPQPMATNAARK